MNEYSNTVTLFEKIKKLTNEAVATYHTKPKAKPYVEQLKFMAFSLPENPLLRNLFDKLVSHVDAASGHGRDKEHWLYFVTQDLVLLENELKRNG